MYAVIIIATLTIMIPTSAAAGVAVEIAGCPHSIELRLPTEFLPARNSQNILEALHSNPNRKTVYAAAFVSENLGLSSVGQSSTILVGSLGSLRKHQGRLTKRDFSTLKKWHKKNNPVGTKELAALLESLEDGASLARGLNIEIGRQIILEQIEIGRNAFALVGVASGAIGGNHVLSYSIARYDFVGGCIANSQFMLPADLSLNQVREILYQFRVLD